MAFSNKFILHCAYTHHMEVVDNQEKLCGRKRKSIWSSKENEVGHEEGIIVSFTSLILFFIIIIFNI